MHIIYYTQPSTQAWRTLARCDGLCGLMLGQAVAMGGGGGPPDAAAVRAWLCSLAVWGPGQEVRGWVGRWVW